MKKLVCAYIYDRSPELPFNLENMDKVDIVNYSFAKVNDDHTIDTSRLFHLDDILALQNENRKVILSIGGWGADGFSQACSSKENRKIFVDSISEFVKKYQIDGIDLDWEYPNSGAAGIAYSQDDTPNFTYFIEELRAALDSIKPGLLITVAVGAGFKCVTDIEIKKIEPLINYLNIMTYDLGHSVDGAYRHHTNLFKEKDDPQVSGDEAITWYHEAGMPYEKIIMGSATYGKVFTLDKNDAPKGHYPYWRIESEVVNDKTVKFVWNEDAHAPLIILNKNHYVTYDDPRSIKEKCAYIKEHNMAGIMYWEYNSDKFGTLLRTMYENLK
ncbi:MAG: hypothetical protein J6W25_02670 [Bacilli bacterium]|nr:hypothetical protein [Bacilli bacterium]